MSDLNQWYRKLHDIKTEIEKADASYDDFVMESDSLSDDEFYKVKRDYYTYREELLRDLEDHQINKPPQ